MVIIFFSVISPNISCGPHPCLLFFSVFVAVVSLFRTSSLIPSYWMFLFFYTFRTSWCSMLMETWITQQLAFSGSWQGVGKAAWQPHICAHHGLRHTQNDEFAVSLSVSSGQIWLGTGTGCPGKWSWHQACHTSGGTWTMLSVMNNPARNRELVILMGLFQHEMKCCVILRNQKNPILLWLLWENVSESIFH